MDVHRFRVASASFLFVLITNVLYPSLEHRTFTGLHENEQTGISTPGGSTQVHEALFLGLSGPRAPGTSTKRDTANEEINSGICGSVGEGQRTRTGARRTTAMRDRNHVRTGMRRGA